ncbi:MAG: radical SAM protein [candidate division Zixibacteria bacterium]
MAAVVGLRKQQFKHEVEHEIISKPFYRKLLINFSIFNREYCSLSPREAEIDSSQLGYHDLLYSDISLSDCTFSSDDLHAASTDASANPYYSYFEENILSTVISREPSVLGISIIAANQVVPAFTLANLIKERIPQIHIVIGGPWCSHVREKLAPKLGMFPFIDSLIVFEGEESLYRLVLALGGELPISEVPNHVLNRDGSPATCVKHCELNMDNLPTPIFNQKDLNKYDTVATFPIQASRGCYWGKCTFCSYPLLEPKYKVRNIEKVIKDIRVLTDSFGAKTIHFSDAIISPNYADKLSKALLVANLNIEWIIFAKFEKAFSKKLIEQMAKSGCICINWGLESGCNRILKTINKSYSLDATQKIIRFAAEAGIHNRILIMYGLPTETLPDALQTVDFVEKNLAYIGSISYGYYHPEINTPMEKYWDDSVINLQQDSTTDLALSYPWAGNIDTGGLKILIGKYKSIQLSISALHRSKIGEGFPASIKNALTGPRKDFMIKSIKTGEGSTIRIESMVAESFPSGKRRIWYEIQ